MSIVRVIAVDDDNDLAGGARTDRPYTYTRVWNTRIHRIIIDASAAAHLLLKLVTAFLPCSAIILLESDLALREPAPELRLLLVNPNMREPPRVVPSIEYCR